MRTYFFRLVALSAMLLTLTVPSLAQSEFECQTPSGFGSLVEEGTYVLDLQCQPGFDFSFNIEPDDSIRIEVNLANYLEATGKDQTDFYIHLAMQRAFIEVREPGYNGVEVMDSGGNIQDIELSDITGDNYIFEIVNKGMRSAIFDLSIRPKRGALR